MRAWAPALWLVLLAGCGPSGVLSFGGDLGRAAPPVGYLVYVRDRAGSVIAAVDDRGEVFSAERDDSFGLALSSTGTPLPRAFLDQDRDEETGYLHFRARSYDPATAQWISPDPKLRDHPDCAAQVHECNPYSFAGDRPLEWTDADGREIDTFIDSRGTVNQVRTLAFVGPQAEVARSAYMHYIATTRSPLLVTVFSIVAKNPAQVPTGMSIINADPALKRADGQYASWAEPATSRINLSKAELEDPRLGQATDHEVLHLAGLGDGYTGSSNGTNHHQNDVMGNFYNQKESNVTVHDVLEVLHPPSPVNQGLTASDPSFLQDPTLQSTQGGGNLQPTTGNLSDPLPNGMPH